MLRGGQSHQIAEQPIFSRGKLYQLTIYLRNFGKVRLVDLDVYVGILLNSAKDIQASTTTVTLQCIGRVRYGLKLPQDEPGDDEPALDEPRLAYIGDSTIDYDASVQNYELLASILSCKFDVGNDQVELILSPQADSYPQVG